MRSAAWRLLVYDGVSARPHVGRQPRGTYLRRHERNHERSDRLVVMNVQGETLENQITYWKEELAGAPTKLELPADKPRPALQSFRGGREIFELPKELLEKLKSIGNQEQATLFMILVAAFMALLHRYSGQDDILVGTPVEIESLIGSVFNTVVLRSLFTDNLNFRALLQQVRERVVGAYAHSDLPFEQIVAELVPERDPSHTPIFQVMFAFHDGEGASRARSNLEQGTRISKFDL